jgi:hypothetical protein
MKLKRKQVSTEFTYFIRLFDRKQKYKLRESRLELQIDENYVKEIS